MLPEKLRKHEVWTSIAARDRFIGIDLDQPRRALIENAPSGAWSDYVMRRYVGMR